MREQDFLLFVRIPVRIILHFQIKKLFPLPPAKRKQKGKYLCHSFSCHCCTSLIMLLISTGNNRTKKRLSRYDYCTGSKRFISSFLLRIFFFFFVKILMIFLRDDGQGHGKFDDFRFALCRDGSIMKLHYLFCNGKAQARTAAAFRTPRRIEPVELFK